MPFAYTVRSDKDTHFTGALAQNAVEEENILLPPFLQGVNGNARCRVKSIVLISDENLAWEVWLWRTDDFQGSDLDTDEAVMRWSFITADGVQYGGSGAYYYFIEGLDSPYVDDDNSGELHIALVNRSAGLKTAGADGEVVIELLLEPMEAENG